MELLIFCRTLPAPSVQDCSLRAGGVSLWFGSEGQGIRGDSGGGPAKADGGCGNAGRREKREKWRTPVGSPPPTIRPKIL